MKDLFLVMILFFGLGCSFEADVLDDQKQWVYNQPGRVGLDQQRLIEIDQTIKEGSYENIEGVLVIRSNQIVFENYYYEDFEGFQKRSLIPLERATLLFSGLALGVLLEEGFLDSIQTPIYRLLPDYEDIFESDTAKKAITLEDLLVHKMGLSWNEALVSYQSATNDLNLMEESEDWTRYVLEKPLEALPGLRFIYHSGSGMIISKIVSEITGRSMEDYLSDKVFDPLNITDWLWESDPEEITNGSGGLFLRLIDWAKIGQLFKDGGIWQDQILIDPFWVEDAVISQNVFGQLYDFGFQWWRFSEQFGFSMILPENDMFFFTNDNGDHLYVIPHQDMIIAISAENYFYGFYNPSLFLYLDLIRSINNT
jgi:CubicO group peptidase (beta-lactamase class C family)